MTTPNPRQYLAMQDRGMDMMGAAPRQRVSLNRATPLTLTEAFQPIPFTAYGNSRDVSTFPAPSRFDYTSRLIKANPNITADQTYNLQLDLAVAHSQVNTFTRVSLRLYVPVPNAPIYAPLPDSLQRVDIPDEVAPANSPAALRWTYTLTAAANLRQYGAQLQIAATVYQRTLLLLGPVNVTKVSPQPSGNNRPQLVDAVLNLTSAT